MKLKIQDVLILNNRLYYLLRDIFGYKVFKVETDSKRQLRIIHRKLKDSLFEV